MLLAKKLINENHNVAIIEEEDRIIKMLQAELDAKIIKGNGIDINILKKADLKNACLYISVSKTDHINLLYCIIARKLCPDKCLIIAKIENSKTTLANVGPGLARVCAIENFAFFDPLSKIVLTFSMFFGRLEVYSVIIMFYALFSKK